MEIPNTDEVPRTGRRRLRRSIYLLPSLFTVGNMFAGFYSIVASFHGHYQNAAIAIGIAVLLDMLDGRVARMANATSDFGMQFDSLADVISFGVAPAVLIHFWGLVEFGEFAQFSAFIFLTCGATRLARFNVQARDLKFFVGLPIPAGAGFIAALVHFLGEPPDAAYWKVMLVGVTYLIAFLMVSTLRYPSLKQLDLSHGKSHLTVLMLALLVAGIIWYSRQVLLLIAIVYVSSGLVIRAIQFVKYRWGRADSVPSREVGVD